MFKEVFACRIVVSANHQYPGNFQRFFCLQICVSRKSSVSRKNPKTFSPAELSQPQTFIIPKLLKVFSTAELSQPQINNIPEIFKDFFACRIALAANHHYPGNIQRRFRLQKCLSRKSSISQKYPKTSSPAELSQQQIIGFPKYSKTFSPAELSQPKIINIRELFKNSFCLQNCLSRKSSISRKYSKTFLPAEVSQPQIIKIPEIFRDFFACRIVLAANRQYPENTQSLFRLQNCLSRKSSLHRTYSKSFSPVEMSQQQTIKIPEIFQDFFACRIVSAANHQYPEKTQRLIGLQTCLSRKSSVSRKDSNTFSPAELSYQQIINIPEKFKDFFACRNVLAANHQYPGNIQRLLCLQNCLSSKSSIPRKYSKTFLPAEMSQPQIINIPEISKDFFACRTVLAANHQYPGNIQRLLRLQNCLSSKSSIPRKYSKTFLPAEMSQPQIINIPEISKDFFACRIVLAANHRFPEICKDFFACRVVLAETHQYPRTIQKLFLPVGLSQPQITNIPERFKVFFACRIVLAANHQYPENTQRLIGLLSCLSPMSSVS